MKHLNVERNKNKIEITLDQPYTGKAELKLITNPLTLTSNKIIEKNFSDGKTFLDSKRTRREFYSVTTLDQNYIGAERKIAVSGLYNCRDLGGYFTTEGKMTKWGCFYRSDAPYHLDTKDIAFLSDMNFASVIDLRSQKEIANSPDIYFAEKNHYNFDPHAEVAKEASAIPTKETNVDKLKVETLVALSKSKSGQNKLIEMQQQMVIQMKELVLSKPAQQAYKDFMDVVLRKEVPCLFHCQGGKDRTGWASAIILGVLGVSKKTIYQDYFLTEQYNEPRNNLRMASYQQYTNNSFVLDYLASLQKTKVEYLDSAFFTMEENFGTIENYAFEVLGLSQGDIEELKHYYLY